MTKPENLSFPPLHCSLERELGDYYQDFSGAITLVESGYHGDVDDSGVPRLALAGQNNVANAVTTSQYAIANMTAVRRGDASRREMARAQLDWLVKNHQRSGNWSGCWLITHDNPKYTWLKAPWTGALASGNAISALLRGWEMFGSSAYQETAEAAYRGLHVDHPESRLYRENGDQLWYEEYPGEPALHVLNGHVYTLFAVLDYARISGDQQAWERWRRGVETAREALGDFDLGYWSAYDLRFHEPTNLHYHRNIHIPQLRILAALTGDERFSTVAERWTRYDRSRVSRVRLAVSLRTRRLMRAR